MRHDKVAAALADDGGDDVCLMAKRAEAGTILGRCQRGLVAGNAGSARCSLWKKKAGSSFAAETDPALFNAIEKAVFDQLASIPDETVGIGQQLTALGALREPIDVFFDKIIINDEDAAIRHDRLGLLAIVRARMLAAADFLNRKGRPL